MTPDVLTRFFEQAERAPNAWAVEPYGEAAVSYGQLASRVRSLGSLLMERGVGIEQVVALSLPKSVDFVVAALACWYAGAAFLPLDPALPADRRTDYLTRASVVHAIGQLDFLAPLTLTVLAPSLTPAQGVQPRRTADPERLAYVIFTSGSSGAPKGVEVCQRGLLPMLDAQVAAFQLQAGQRSLWLLSSAFDASLSDLGTALVAGACLVIDDEALMRDPARLLACLREREIHYVDLPPSLLPYIDPERLPDTLHSVVIGGEPCDAATVRSWSGRVRLINVYGPTEATVCTSLGLCSPDWQRALLGRELPGVRYSVRDERGNVLGIAQRGELWIAGVCLARGYLAEPLLTAARFVERDGQRWFRTGDLVVRHEDGELEFLGRGDRQLKVRGALVAPEEIETQLMRHPAVRRAAVVSTEQPAALIAVVEGDAVNAAELRAFLAERLPPALLPSRFVFDTPIAVTVSGKPDLPRLRALTAQRREHDFEPALTDTEQQLSQLIARLLGTAVGRHDDFFALGGSSISLLGLLRDAQRVGLNLRPEHFQGATTVRDLADAIESDQSAPLAMCTEQLATLVDQQLRLLPHAANTVRATGAGSFFVTGATGFLGSRVAYELLQRTDRPIVCLVRGKDPRQAHERLCAALEVNGVLLEPQQRARLVPRCGDIGDEQLGLTRAQYLELTRDVSCIFHCAALVSHLAKSSAHLRCNLYGTRRVLELAARCSAVELHYASTLSVFVADEPVPDRCSEADALERSRRMYGGYAQSKWAAELLVRERAAFHRQTTIHRLGLLTGDSQTGRSARSDWLTLTITALARLGVLPSERDPALAVDVTPVDYAARAMVEVALTEHPKQQLETLHLCGPAPVPFERWLEALRALGVPLKPVANQAFEAQLGLSLRDDPTLACAALSLQRMYREEYRPDLDLFRATSTRFDDRRARELLTNAGVLCPQASPALLIRYVRDIMQHASAGASHE